MGKVVTYANNDRQCFCQIRFDSREGVLISIAARPTPSLKVIRLALGFIPRQTICECNATIAGGSVAYVRDLMDMFAPDPAGPTHPLDIIRDIMLRCSSIEDASRTLRGRQEKIKRSGPRA